MIDQTKLCIHCGKPHSAESDRQRKNRLRKDYISMIASRTRFIEILKSDDSNDDILSRCIAKIAAGAIRHNHYSKSTSRWDIVSSVMKHLMRHVNLMGKGHRKHAHWHDWLNRHDYQPNVIHAQAMKILKEEMKDE